MEEIQNAFRKVSEETRHIASAAMNNARLSSSAAPPPITSANTSSALITRPPRNMVSLWTCSKLCAIFFVAGVVVGYTLKRRVRRWASKLLRRMKDD